MNFKQAEKRFKELENQFSAGKLSEADFKAQLKELMIQDSQGNWWAIGYKTKTWHRYNGREWVQADPGTKQRNIYGSIALIIIVLVIGFWGVSSSIKSSILNDLAIPTGVPGPAGPAGPTGPSAGSDNITCIECHNNSGVIPGIKATWSTSLHAIGESYYGGFSASCAGCHSGNGFTRMINDGLNPDQVEFGESNPTRQDCYACHQIHSSYTTNDWTLITTGPVELYALEGVTYDGGNGNLCANCHQPRRTMEIQDGLVNWTSTHYGTHHGPQSAMLLGIAGNGIEGRPSAHYTMVENTCVGCHLGEDNSHTFAPQLSTCQECHADAYDFDINGYQTEVTTKLDELSAALEAMGMLQDDAPVVGVYPETESGVLWNYMYIKEDKSMGAHNPAYTLALLDWSLEQVSNSQ